MTKNKSKFLTILLIFILSLATVCYAEEGVNNTPEPRTTGEQVEPINEPDSNTPTDSGEGQENPEETPTEGEEENQNPQDQIHQDDLYLSGFDVTMDKLVDGNVYIVANNVKITGQVAGNMYIMANTVEFQDAYVQSSVYVLANSVKFGAVAYDLYASCATLEIPNDHGVYRDIRAVCNEFNLSGIISRNASISANKINVSGSSQVYGNFNYTSPSEVLIPEANVDGEINYTKSNVVETSKEKITSMVISAIIAIVLAFVIYGLSKWLTPNTLEKANKVFSRKWPIAIGFGIATLILTPIASFLLLISVIGAPVGILLLAFYLLLLAISTPVATITIANAISEKLKLSKIPMKLLFIAIVSIILYAIGFIPYAGSIITLIVTILGFGIVLVTLFGRNLNFEKKEKEKSEKKEDK